MFEDDWRLIEELLDEGSIISAEDNPDLNVPGKFFVTGSHRIRSMGTQ